MGVQTLVSLLVSKFFVIVSRIGKSNSRKNNIWKINTNHINYMYFIQRNDHRQELMVGQVYTVHN